MDEYLTSPLFREVSRLSVFPGDNQILRRREGYRQIFAAWALVEGAIGLNVDLDDPLLVSRKSIATLYEYWTFVPASQCGGRTHVEEPEIVRDLFKPSASGCRLSSKPVPQRASSSRPRSTASAYSLTCSLTRSSERRAGRPNAS